DRIVVSGAPLAPQVFDNQLSFLLTDIGSVDPGEPGRTGRDEKHVAIPQKLFRAVGIDDGSGVDLRGHLEGDPAGKIRLDHSGDYVDRGSLGGEDQMNADGPGHRSQS